MKIQKYIKSNAYGWLKHAGVYCMYKLILLYTYIFVTAVIVYIYIYIHIHIYVHTYIHTYMRHLLMLLEINELH